MDLYIIVFFVGCDVLAKKIILKYSTRKRVMRLTFMHNAKEILNDREYCLEKLYYISMLNNTIFFRLLEIVLIIKHNLRTSLAILYILSQILVKVANFKESV